MDIFSTLPALIVYSILYGLTMKVADLLNEHGLKWFKYSDVLFGILWGLFGLLIVCFGDAVSVSVMVAMNMAFLIRNRLDYINHQIASTIIILGGFIVGNVLIPELLIFYFTFLIFGYIKDYVDDVLHSENILAQMNELMLYYPIPTFVYSVIYGNWNLFWIFTTYTFFYDLTKYVARKYGYK